LLFYEYITLPTLMMHGQTQIKFTRWISLETLI